MQAIDTGDLPGLGPEMRPTAQPDAAIGQAVTALGLSVGALFARELKEFDNDINYDEARVPHYDLPDPLVTAEGKPVTSAEQWRNIRRPQILSLFANFVYGAVPVPPDPIVQTYRVVKEDKSFMGGKATRLDVAIRFKNRKGTAETLVLVFLPRTTLLSEMSVCMERRVERHFSEVRPLNASVSATVARRLLWKVLAITDAST